MTIEDKLKDYILSNYKSIREFVNTTDIPYSTVDAILKRGIGKASIGNIFKICNALHISSDELANNKIVPVGESIQGRTHMTDIDKIIEYTKRNIQEYDDLIIDGEPLSLNEVEMLLDALDLTVGLIKRNRNRMKTEQKQNENRMKKDDEQ